MSSLCGEKRLENAVHDFLLNAVTRVSDCQLKVSARGRFFYLEGMIGHNINRFQPDIQHTAFFLHGVGRIGEQIHENLMNLCGIAHDKAICMG